MDSPSDQRVAPAVRDVIIGLAAKPYARLFGIEIIDIRAGAVTLSLTSRSELGHRPGWFQGAITSALGEYAASWSTISLADPDCETVTLEQSIRFVGAARGERLIAVGRMIAQGRSISTAAADIFAERDGKRTLCAVLSLTNRHAPPKSRAAISL
ncbi:MAG: PaaI family thioesterase [Sphingomicrobium sp.]